MPNTPTWVCECPVCRHDAKSNRNDGQCPCAFVKVDVNGKVFTLSSRHDPTSPYQVEPNYVVRTDEEFAKLRGEAKEEAKETAEQVAAANAAERTAQETAGQVRVAETAAAEAMLANDKVPPRRTP